MSAATAMREPIEALGFREASRQARARRRDAANARAVTEVDGARVRDPLAHRASVPERALATVLGFAAASLALHIAAVTLAALFAPSATPPRTVDVPVELHFVDPPKPAAPPPPEVPTAEPVVPLPVPVVVKRVVERVKEPVPPPDPVDVAPPPTVAELPKEPPRRVVGLEMSSTVVGGAGPAFATGNTRMGETSTVASDPTGLEHLAAESIPPRRTSAPKPEYPAALRAQGVEGAVGVRAEIDASGHVTNVTVVEASPHDEFNRAAIDAAQRSAYEPARTNGVAVARAIEFTVRFRLHE